MRHDPGSGVIGVIGMTEESAGRGQPDARSTPGSRHLSCFEGEAHRQRPGQPEDAGYAEDEACPADAVAGWEDWNECIARGGSQRCRAIAGGRDRHGQAGRAGRGRGYRARNADPARSEQIRRPVPPGRQCTRGRSRRPGNGTAGEQAGGDEGRGVRGGALAGQPPCLSPRPAVGGAVACRAARGGPRRETESGTERAPGNAWRRPEGPSRQRSAHR